MKKLIALVALAAFALSSASAGEKACCDKTQAKSGCSAKAKVAKGEIRTAKGGYLVASK
jgi:hypothetical protein